MLLAIPSNAQEREAAAVDLLEDVKDIVLSFAKDDVHRRVKGVGGGLCTLRTLARRSMPGAGRRKALVEAETAAKGMRTHVFN